MNERRLEGERGKCQLLLLLPSVVAPSLLLLLESLECGWLWCPGDPFYRNKWKEKGHSQLLWPCH